MSKETLQLFLELLKQVVLTPTEPGFLEKAEKCAKAVLEISALLEEKQSSS